MQKQKFFNFLKSIQLKITRSGIYFEHAIIDSYFSMISAVFDVAFSQSVLAFRVRRKRISIPMNSLFKCSGWCACCLPLFNWLKNNWHSIFFIIKWKHCIWLCYQFHFVVLKNCFIWSSKQLRNVFPHTRNISSPKNKRKWRKTLKFERKVDTLNAKLSIICN